MRKTSKTKIKLNSKSKGLTKKPKNTVSPYVIFLAITFIFCFNYLRSTDIQVSLAVHPRYKQKLSRNYDINSSRVTDQAVAYQHKATMNNQQSTGLVQIKTSSQTTDLNDSQTSSKQQNKNEIIRLASPTTTMSTTKTRKTTAAVHSRVKSDKPRNMIVSIGEPVVHRKAENTIGAWMKDQTLNNNFVYVLENYVKNNKVKVYTSEANETLAHFYLLPYYWGGTGHVVMNGNLYFSKYNSNKIVKYNFEQRDVVLEKTIPGAGYANSCPYQWAGSSDVDLAADSEGLWVIYATEANEWNITIGRLDENTLEVTKTWNTRYTKRWAGNAFMAYGILYALKRYDSYSTTLNYAFDTKTNSVLRPNITMTIRNQFLTMLDYYHRERRLYAWDKGDLTTYDVKVP
uniref:Noelin-3-like n=1 Tax=Phallusia mammillata TaxID=59560 RepID=A0A6F9DMZ6_9ASCI|nr:noelin-3-like [Phallusia mammillata]